MSEILALGELSELTSLGQCPQGCHSGGKCHIPPPCLLSSDCNQGGWPPVESGGREVVSLASEGP